MGTSLCFSKTTFFLLLMVPFVALMSTPSIVWMAHPQLSCPLDQDSELPELDFDRSDFPDNFVFGTATSAYQVEGAVHEGGRGPSIWDIFSHIPGRTLDGGTGDVAVDQYHRFQDDSDLLKSMHMDAYRFSISWTRIFPDGQGPGVNKEGLLYYNNLIDDLLSRGVQPYATLYHWDLPQALEDTFEGWISQKIVRHFADFAEACFSAFGDRVKNWITFNEPWVFVWQGYGSGVHAPGRTSDRSWSLLGNSSTDPYLASHNVLLAHATAVDIYRKKFQASQGGTIGITLNAEWAEPMTNSPEDAEASQRHMLFQLGWFLDPIFFGDYPAVMREHVGARLPAFSEDELASLQGSIDFIGLNHYTSRWVTSAPPPVDPTISNLYEDECVTTSVVRDGTVIGPNAYSEWLYIVPWGLEKLVLWTWDRYKFPIYITENGMDTHNNQSVDQPPPIDFLHDSTRINFYHDYLASLLRAIRKGADVRCYFAWSLLDNFEWASGFTSRFGLFYVDYSSLKRYPKNSAKWFTKFLQPRRGGPA